MVEAVGLPSRRRPPWLRPMWRGALAPARRRLTVKSEHLNGCRAFWEPERACVSALAGAVRTQLDWDDAGRASRRRPRELRAHRSREVPARTRSASRKAWHPLGCYDLAMRQSPAASNGCRSSGPDLGSRTRFPTSLEQLFRNFWATVELAGNARSNILECAASNVSAARG